MNLETEIAVQRGKTRSFGAADYDLFKFQNGHRTPRREVLRRQITLGHFGEIRFVKVMDGEQVTDKLFVSSMVIVFPLFILLIFFLISLI